MQGWACPGPWTHHQVRVLGAVVLMCRVGVSEGSRGQASELAGLALKSGEMGCRPALGGQAHMCCECVRLLLCTIQP
jgi:hypothetical protein